jgi:DNA polymerase-1
MEIENQHEIIPYILRHRKIQKLLSTYIDEFNQIAKRNDGYIRTVFNQTQTATGRLSSSEPNLQNLPIRDEEGKKLRKVFISRFENGEIVSADYNQIELRLMAHYSQDENLVRAYKNNEDIHTRTASSIFGIPLSEITPTQRRLAKTVNFGIIYGISDYGLSLSLGTSVAKAKAYIIKYFEVFPRVKEYVGESIELAKERGYASTLFGRIRFIPDLKSENFAMRKFGERVAINMPLQGTASDIIKIAMINVYNKLKENN